MTWEFKLIGKKPKLTNPILVEGLPGIGNIGKVAVDFIIEEVNAKKLYEVTSFSFPHSVFVNEENLIEMPVIEVFYAKRKKQDLILLSGDIQPMDEKSCYEFCHLLLSKFESLKGKEIITIGGIGLQDVPKVPKVYCTGNNKKIIDKYKKGTKLNNNIYGVVGPIVGVTGLLLGLAGKKKIPAIALLAETIGHPMYLGIKGSREVLKILDKKLDLGIDLNKLDSEIKDLEKEIKFTTEKLAKIQKDFAKKNSETSYIG
jgi:uncharacterized protein